MANTATVGFGSCAQNVNSSTGVFVSIQDGHCIIKFTATGSNSWTVPTGVNSVEIFVVGGGAGGGGGGWNGNLNSGGGGGGGGSGSVVRNNSTAVTPSSSVTISVGEGGAGGSKSDKAAWEGGDATNGTASSFGGYTAAGGSKGRGGGKTANGTRTEYFAYMGTNYNDGAGGEGGTNSNYSSGRGYVNPSTPDLSQGAGGGGAGSATNGYNATGTSGGFGIGGAGTTYLGAIYAVGGNGGQGGDSSVRGTGISAPANTGSGGAGGGGWGTASVTDGFAGGNGGSGIVIVKYQPTSTISFSQCTQTVSNTTGVEISSIGNDCIVRFTATGNNSWTVPIGVASVRTLIIGGGGGGGAGIGGGGGAGEMIETSSLVVTSGAVINLSVGGGGAAGTLSSSTDTTTGQPGSAGSSSTFSGIEAFGGGGGGANANAPTNVTNTGSGGGAGYSGSGRTVTARTISGSVVSKNSGGNGSDGGAANATAGGGGGAGINGGSGTTSSGSPAQTGGNGGEGKSSDISGFSTFYAGGGAGGVNGGTGAISSGNAGVGGIGGGGAGGLKYNQANNLQCSNPDGSVASINNYGCWGYPGQANTGSGGGGGSNSQFGGAGGSGVVIVRYTLASQSALTLTSTAAKTGSPLTLTTSGGSGSGAVTYSVSSAGTAGCSISSSTLTATSAGTCTVTATKAAADGYLSASSNATTIRVAANQTIDSALTFGGVSAEYALPSSSQIIPASGAFTLEAWVKPANGTSANSSAVIVSQGSTSTSRFYVKRYTTADANNGMIYFYRDSGSSEANCGYAPPEVWTHITITYNGSGSSTCYLNGVARVSLSASGSITSSFTLASYSLDKNNQRFLWKGSIDEVRVYSDVRIPTEIQSDMFTYGPVSEGNLVAYYDFNEDSGSALANQAAGSNSDTDLTISGSPTWNNIATTSSSSNRTIVTFERSYLNNSGGWATPQNVTSAQVIVVGGGGGGGDSKSQDPDRATGGSGGAGGYFENGNVPLAGVSPVVVGVGGTGALATNTQASNGFDSFFGSLKTGGGGGGNSYGFTSATRARSGNGGPDYVSGGNGGGGRAAQDINTASTTGGLGGVYSAGGVTFNGSSFTGHNGVVGGSASSDFGSGGIGGSISTGSRTSTITGTSTVYAKSGTYLPWGQANNTSNPQTYGSGGSTNYNYGSAETAGNTLGGNGAQGVVIVSWQSTFTVTYDSKGGSAVSAGSFDLGGSIASAPSDPNKSGYTFAGWVTSSDGTGTPITFPYTPSSNANLTLYAKWTQETYVVTFASGTGGAGSNQTKSKNGGESLVLPKGVEANSWFTKAGYDVIGWATTDGGAIAYELGGSYTADSATTLYPVWGLNKFADFTSSTPGSASATGKSFRSSTAGISDKTSFTVEAWFFDKAGSAGQNPIVSQGADLANSFTVMTTDGTGTAGTRNLVVFFTSFAITITNVANNTWHHVAVTRNGSSYVVYIDGVNKSSGTVANDTATGTNFVIGENVYYMAPSVYHLFHGYIDQVKIWNSALTSAQVQASMHSYGDAGISGPTLVHLYDFNNSPTTTLVDQIGALNLTANGSGSVAYSTFGLTNNFDANSGSSVNGSTFHNYNLIQEPTAPNRSGYTFEGWSTVLNDVNTKVTFPYAPWPFANETLYALWSANSVTVTFNPNYSGGPSNTTQSVQINTSTALTSNTFSRNGYTFAGWNTEANGTGTNYSDGQSISISTGLTLYAKWTFSATPVFSYNASDINSYESTATSVTDLSGNSVDGIGYRSLAYDTSTYAWSFAGGGTSSTTGAYIDIEDVTTTQFVNASGLTIDIEADFGSTADNYERIFDFGVSGPRYGNVAVGREGTTNNLELRIYQVDSTNLRLYCRSSNAITSGMHRWTITVDGSACRMFKNGNLLTTSTTTALSYLPVTGLTWNVNWIGRSYFGADAAFEGKVRSTQLYAGSFTPTEIGSFSYKTVTFSANGGDTTPSAKTTSGKLRLPAGITRTGYTFSGWYDASSGGNLIGASSAAYTPNADITLHAQWTAGTYTITYDSNGGNAISSGTYTTGGTAITLPTPTKTGYTFDGWFEASNFSGSALSSPYSPTQTRTIYAKWTANNNTVTFNSNFGTPTTSTQTIVSGASTALSNNSFNRTGYSFAGWNTLANGTGTSYTNGQSVTIYAPLTLYAQWTEVNYTVTYDKNGATGAPEKLSEVYGISTGALTLSTTGTMTRTGYTFDGWYTAASGGTRVGGASDSYTPTSNVTLYAQWTAVSYPITFNSTGSTSGTAPSALNFTTGGAALTIPGAGSLAKTGYTFSKWNTRADGLGTDYAIGASLTTSAPVALHPIWTANSYSITYSDQNKTSGTAPTDGNVYNIGNTAYVKANTGLVRTGYTFAGWTTTQDNSGTSYQSGDTYTFGSANVTFYPKWTENTYNVTYNSNGATGTPARTSDTYTTGDPALTLPGRGTMTKTGYTFTGWSTSPTGIGQTSATTTSDVTLYAIWDLNRYTITFNRGMLENISLSGSQVATFPANTEADYNTSITLGSSPANVSENVTVNSNLYQFFGWSDGNTIFNPGQSYLVAAIAPTFTAQWIRLYEVRYALNGGSGIVDVDPECQQANNTCLSNQPITLSDAPSRAGYEFAGWKDQANNSFNAGATTNVTSTSFVYYAQWAPINYSITFDSIGGSNSPTAETKNIGQTVTLPSPGTRTGYDFSGWTLGGVTYGVGTTFTVGSTNAAFTALWTAKRFNVSYDWNGGVGTPTASSVYTYGNAAITLPTGNSHTKDGYVFNGWKDQDGNPIGSTHTPTQDTRYVAQWIDGSYTLTYNTVGGTLAQTTVNVSRTATTTLPTPTRTNYTFDGWYEDPGNTVPYGQAAASVTPVASKTLYAKWVQDSLVGINPAHLNSLTTITTQSGNASSWTGTHSLSGTGASLNIPADALPNGTVVQVSFVEDLTRPKNIINNTYAYYTSVVLHWQLGTGSSATVPVAADGKPLVLTLTNPDIRAGAKIYKIIRGEAREVATATQDGQVTINVYEDPEIVVAATTPTAPRSVTAIGNLNAQSSVSWTAPVSSGGASVSGYTVTANPGGATCTTTGETTCIVTGLSNDTSYNFTVTATNAVGASVASATSNSVIPRLVPTFKAVFDSNGGSAVADSLFTQPGALAEPAAPTRTGYTFGGWLTQNGVASSVVTFPYSPGVNGDLTLYAYWIANAPAASTPSTGPAPTSSAPINTFTPITNAPSTALGEKPPLINMPTGPTLYSPPQTQFQELRNAPYPTNGLNIPLVGEVISLVNREPVQTRVTTVGVNTLIEIGENLSMTLTSQTELGESVAPSAGGAITVLTGGFIDAAGSGFKAGAPIEAWLYSDPIRLGDGIAAADGTFANKFAINSSVPLGKHTVVLNGLTPTDEIVTIALGVEVIEELDQEVPGPEPMAGSSNNDDLASALSQIAGVAFIAVLLAMVLLAVRRRKGSQ